MSLKDNWKQTGVGLGHAFRDLGKSVVKSVATGVKKVDNWANKEDNKPEEAKEQPQAPLQAEEARPEEVVFKAQPEEQEQSEWRTE